VQQQQHCWVTQQRQRHQQLLVTTLWTYWGAWTQQQQQSGVCQAVGSPLPAHWLVVQQQVVVH
jgi:hypothetical protein